MNMDKISKVARLLPRLLGAPDLHGIFKEHYPALVEAVPWKDKARVFFSAARELEKAGKLNPSFAPHLYRCAPTKRREIDLVLA